MQVSNVCISILIWLGQLKFWAKNSLQWKLGMHMLTFEIPRWSQDGPRLPNSLKMAPKLIQNVSQNQCFLGSYSMNYAMLSDISSIRKNKWSNTNQIMPTSTKKTHTTQRGVGGMRRRPGKFQGWSWLCSAALCSGEGDWRISSNSAWYPFLFDGNPFFLDGNPFLNVASVC